MACERVTRKQAKTLLIIAREHARPVNPERLGAVGRGAFDQCWYAIERSTANLGSTEPKAEVPFVVEAWAHKINDKGDPTLTMMVNRTPVTGEIDIYRNANKDLVVHGCGCVTSSRARRPRAHTASW